MKLNHYEAQRLRLATHIIAAWQQVSLHRVALTFALAFIAVQVVRSLA